MPSDLSKQQALKEASELARKFGFVSREIVWKHLSFQGRSSRFKYWQFLKKAAELQTYRAGITSNGHLMLSLEYRKSLGKGAAVSQRSSIYFEHDEYLMDFIMWIKRAGVVGEYWTEQELKMDRLLSLEILGGDPDGKLPDLVFDLMTFRGRIRVAIEIERTRKSQARYRQVQWGYYRLRKIDLLLFGVNDSGTESAISREFNRSSISGEKRSTGYFSLAAFGKSGLESELRIRDKNPTLGEFFSRICGAKWQLQSDFGRQIGDKMRIPVSKELPIVEETK